MVHLPDEAKAIVREHSLREAADQETCYEIYKQLAGEPFTEPRQSLPEIIGETALLLLTTNDPSIPEDFGDSIRISFPGIFEASNAPGEVTLTGRPARCIHGHAWPHVRGDDRFDLDTVIFFEQFIAAARKIALREKKTIAQVYADDELFYEILPTAFSLSLYAALIANSHFGYIPEEIREAEEAASNVAQLPGRTNNLSAEHEIEDSTGAEPEDTEVWEETIRQIFLFIVAKSWEAKEFETLPEDLQAVLKPTRSLAPIVEEAVSQSTSQLDPELLKSHDPSAFP